MAAKSLCAFGLWAATCSAADPGYHSPVGDIEVFYGVIPSQVVLGHPVEHAERKMHGGVPPGRNQYHLIISLFDGKTKQRIVDAGVSARISAVGLHTQQKKLKPMEFAGAVTYGNYFRMPTSSRCGKAAASCITRMRTRCCRSRWA